MILTYDSHNIIRYLESKLSLNRNEVYYDLFLFLKNKEYKFKIIKDIKKPFKEIYSNFISEQIRDNLKLLKNGRQIVFETNNLLFNMNIFYNDDNIDKFISEIINTISFTTSLCEHEFNEYTINYYLTNNKKIFKDDDYPTHDSVNSGSASSIEINIWRKEEVLKVTIHELIHLLNYDYKNDSSLLKEHYINKYNLTSDKVNTFEAYTELWANLVNCFLISMKKENEEYDYFCLFINIEKHFCRLQKNKIFLKYDLTNKKNNLNKYTNVLAYYVIRCELFNNLSKLLKNFKKNNENYIKCNYNNIEKTLLKENIILKNDFKKSLNKFINSTSRMSCIELELFNEYTLHPYSDNES
jgi:hypothetical protein